MKNRKKDEEDLEEVMKKFDDACMDEAVKHLSYLKACLDDKKTEDEIKELKEQIKSVERTINDKKNPIIAASIEIIFIKIKTNIYSFPAK